MPRQRSCARRSLLRAPHLGTLVGVMPLSADERAVLDVERSWWKSYKTKAEAIRETPGISSARYYAILRRMAVSPDALARDPLVVRRLRRRLSEKRREQIERPFGRPGR